MFISQEKAKTFLRKEAGFSIAKAEACVKNLPKTQDGKRLKIRSADIRKIIDESNKPTPQSLMPSEIKIRPFRKDLVARIRREKGLPPKD